MRIVALLLLVLSGISAVRNATDRVHPDDAVRSIPRRTLLASIASPSGPFSPSPFRREVRVESAIDEESDESALLDFASRGIDPDLILAARSGPFATRPTPGPSGGGSRSSPLRC